MDKCPYCGAETRPGDNFCLNCGNRLVSNQGAQQEVGESTQASPEEWNAPAQGQMATENAWPAEPSAATIASPGDDPATYRADLPNVQQQQSSDAIEHPARFVLRADDGTVLQEYLLDKQEITIGRAPTSDILLSKDKLTSRRHATVRYENGNYVLRDERSANGTFVNGQQIEELVPRVLQEGDHIGIGEHELLFRSYGSPSTSLEDMPTIAVPYEPSAEMTYRTREDALATAATSDAFRTHSMDNDSLAAAHQQEQQAQQAQVQPEVPEVHEEEVQAETPAASNGSSMPQAPIAAPSIPVATSYASTPSASPDHAEPVAQSAENIAAPVTSTPAPNVAAQSQASSVPVTNVAASAASSTPGTDTNVTFSRLTNISQPTLPDMTALMAALSSLDGQVMSLQEQLNATQDSLRNRDAEIAQTSNQLRAGVRRVTDRMDNTIADVARSREALAWAELSQLMEDVMNNPRDIEYVTKLARKARELNKLFQIHQNVLNTMYECNSLLRALMGEEK